MTATLLDDRSRPDFRELYGRHAGTASTIDAAVRRIRLAGVTLDRELQGVRRMRVVVAELNALTLSCEAESIGADPARTPRLVMLAGLLEEGRLQVRMAPLAGWDPDFSVFSGDGPEALMLGRHWFERPYPHLGPAFAVVLEGEAAVRARGRFDELWSSAYDVGAPIQSLIEDALRRVRANP